MSTLFMVGNGFDLNCGMQTRYCNVYSGYIKTESETETIVKFKQEIQDNIENWSDFELSMAEYASTFDKESDFVDCINDFSSYISDYLKEEERKVLSIAENSQLNEMINNEMRQSFSSFYKGISNNIDNMMYDSSKSTPNNSLSIISFNYTKVFDTFLANAYIGYLITVPRVIHIHGTVEDLILGMDNEKQIEASFTFTNSFKRSFIKPFFNMQYDNKRVLESLTAIERADTICVFGMSLGVSDLMWRNKLIEWMKEAKFHHLIMYDYEMSNMVCKTVPQRMDIEERAKMNKLMTWGVDNVEEIIDQFHIVCGRNIFNINSKIELFKENGKLTNNGGKFGDKLLNEPDFTG